MRYDFSRMEPGTSEEDKRYDFSRMEPGTFEEMVKSLAYGEFGIKLSSYGAGPDGQRDFTVRGTVKECGGETLEGFTIGQVKYKDTITKKSDYDWLRDEIYKELKHFREKKKEDIPDNYILYTNIVLTPAKDTGVKDRIDKYVKSNNDIIKKFYIRGYDDICLMLDNNRNVATAYRDCTLPGDILELMLRKMETEYTEAEYTEAHFPDGNVIHNGHIEYFPSIIEATPFNYVYFLVSKQQNGIAASLEKILEEYSSQGHVWREYTVQSFLKGTIERLDEGDKAGSLVYMDANSIKYIKLLIEQWRRVAGDNPIIINVYVEGEEFMETVRRIKTILLELDWGQEFDNKQTEIDSPILVQTEQSSLSQNVEDTSKCGKDELERWRILLSDRYYFEQVLNYREKILVKYLLCQRLPVCKGVKEVEADRRLLERYDRERFIKYKYEWEEF